MTCVQPAITCLHSRVRVAAVCTLLLSGSAQAWAAQAQPGMPDVGPDMRPAEIQRLFDAYFVMEAQRALGLSDQQYPPFLTRLRALQETRRRNVQQRNQLIGELQRLTSGRADARADDAALTERLNALQELESRAAAEARKAYSSLFEVLEIRQQARFRVFEEQIERRKLELLMRSRLQNRPLPRRGNQRPQGR